MRVATATALSTLLALPGAALLASPASAHPGHDEAAAPFDALVFSKTAGFRHDSIPAGIQAIRALGAQNDFTVTATEDAAAFTDANLAQYEVVIWLSTTGDVLNEEQQGAFERYIGNGGGYAGIHAASDTEYDWPWYGELVGAYFASHPAGTPDAVIDVHDQVHPSTHELPVEWPRTDEWYNYQDNPRGDVHVLATLEESSYSGGTMPGDHPIAWCQDYEGGRSWYTGGGHTQASFSEPQFVQHLLGGIQTAAGVLDADCGATVEDNFEVVTLAKGADKTGEPIAMAVLPDRRVLHTSRDGRVWLTTPNATTSLAASIPVYNHDEDGLQGIAIDPDFASNGWVYVYYAPPLSTPGGDAPANGTAAQLAPFDGHNVLSRMKLVGNSLDRSTEQEILQVPANRGTCCHAGGEIDFDADGNLFLSTGDDSNPFDSAGYTPIDERSGRNPAYDAQRTSANTNDLRGKLLRIKVSEDGSYTVPAGNMFDEAGDTAGKTRPEIYAMGFRNPFRFAVDDATGWVHLADYGPDAGAASPTRGPGGKVELNVVKAPGNFGWPYCHGDNEAYIDYDFGTGQSGAAFDCAAPKNTSPNNTGLVDLPPAQLPMLTYDGGSVPELGSGSESPMGGPTYRYDAENPSTTKFPEYYDGKNFPYEFGRGWIKELLLDDEGGLVEINPFLDSFDFKQLMNLEFGPDGALYVLDYGTGFFNGDQFSAVYRIDYVKGSRAPVARASADVTSGTTPLAVQFSSEGSRDPDGDPVEFAWDFDGDGEVDSTLANPSHTYTEAGRYTAALTVTDASGESAGASVNITAGNTMPEVTITLPPGGGVFDYGDIIKYEITVTDPEDGTEIDCSKVRLDTALGHNEHTHGDQNFQGCSGQFVVPQPWEDKTQHSFYVLTATYTDAAVPGLELTGSAQVVLETKVQQAEFFDAMSGIQVVDRETAAGGKRVGYTEPGDWLRFDDFNLTGVESIVARTSGPGNTTMQVRADAPDGPLLATVPVLGSGDWEAYREQAPAEIADPGGTFDLYITFPNGGMDLDEFTLEGTGVSGNRRPVLTASASPLSGEAPLQVDFSASATDPEGTDVSLVWDFDVDGAPAPTTGEASFTYTQPGVYTASVTATDEDGSRSVRTFTVTVTAPPLQCEVELPGSDSFDGEALDRSKWTKVVRENAATLQVRDGSLVLPTGSYDMYNSNTSAENIVLQPMPSGAWTATTKVTVDPQQQYQQAGLIVYGNDQNWSKFDFIRGGSLSFEFIPQRNGVADNQGAADAVGDLPADFPRTVWMRLSSDGVSLTAAYSTDGTTWQEFGRAHALASIPDAHVGLFALNGGQASASVIDAEFDSFSLRAAGDGGDVDRSDEFDGDSLDGCRWGSVVRGDSTAYRVGGGALEIDLQGGDIYGTDNSGPRNLLLQSAPGGDFVLETKVTVPLEELYQQAGILAYVDDDNYVKWDLVANNASGSPLSRRLELRTEVAGAVSGPADITISEADLPVDAPIWLRLTKSGTTYAGQYSFDGTTWLDYTSTVEHPAETPKIGVFAIGPQQTAASEVTASFDWFRVSDGSGEVDTTAPTVAATVDPQEPDGEAGWYVSPVEVSVTAEDDREGAVLVEHRLDDGEWAEHSGPLTVDEDGEHTVEFRATDAAGNVSETGSVDVAIDATAPVVGVGGVQAGASYGASQSLSPTWIVTDATSGVAGSTTVELDGEPFDEGTALALHLLTVGEHELVVTGRDVAGNETSTSVLFTVTTSPREIAVLVQRFYDQRLITSGERTNLLNRLDGAIKDYDRNRKEQAARHMVQFLDRLEGRTANGPVKDILRYQGETVLAQLRA